jgi:hypothetical protein
MLKKKGKVEKCVCSSREFTGAEAPVKRPSRLVKNQELPAGTTFDPDFHVLHESPKQLYDSHKIVILSF